MRCRQQAAGHLVELVGAPAQGPADVVIANQLTRRAEAVNGFQQQSASEDLVLSTLFHLVCLDFE